MLPTDKKRVCKNREHFFIVLFCLLCARVLTNYAQSFGSLKGKYVTTDVFFHYLHHELIPKNIQRIYLFISAT